MATYLPVGNPDWVHGDYRGNWTEAQKILASDGSVSCYGFKKYGAWATLSHAYKRPGVYKVRLFAHRDRDDRTEYVTDLNDVARVLRDFGHPSGNPRWFWSRVDQARSEGE